MFKGQPILGPAVLCALAVSLSACNSKSTSPTPAPRARTPADGLYAKVIQMADGDRAVAMQACDAVFAAGAEAVPVLIEYGEDPRPAPWDPPTYFGRALPGSLTLGEKCIYLLEAIRTGRLAHTGGPYFTCDGEQNTRCAVAEYQKWYTSRSPVAFNQFDSAAESETTYKPAVDWSRKQWGVDPDAPDESNTVTMPTLPPDQEPLGFTG